MMAQQEGIVETLKEVKGDIDNLYPLKSQVARQDERIKFLQRLVYGALGAGATGGGIGLWQVLG